eukprot:285628_1
MSLVTQSTIYLYGAISQFLVLICTIVLWFRLNQSLKKETINSKTPSKLRKCIFFYFSLSFLWFLFSEIHVVADYLKTLIQFHHTLFDSIPAISMAGAQFFGFCTNDAISIYFFLKLKDLFKNTFLAINSTYLNILLIINILLSIPAMFGAIMITSISYWNPSISDNETLYLALILPYALTALAYLFTLNIFFVNRLYKFISLTTQNDKNL